MSGWPLLPPVDVFALFRCSHVCHQGNGRLHRCGGRAVSVYSSPLGRQPRCARHEQSAADNPAWVRVL
jgi:hypothetical protein